MFSKIDRALANEAWKYMFPTADVSYLPEGEFDHCAGVLCISPNASMGKKPFRFFNMW